MEPKVKTGQVEVARPQKPHVATAHWDHSFSPTFNSIARGAVCSINVPTNLTKRKIYAIALATTPDNLIFDGEIVFSLAGAPVLRLPFKINLGGSFVRFSGADSNFVATQSPDENIWIECPSSLGTTFPIGPTKIEIACSRIEIISFERTVVSGGSTFEVFLGCQSEGKEASE